jgi:hypothetical protein
VIHLLIPPVLGLCLWACKQKGVLTLRLAIGACALAVFAMVYMEGMRLGLAEPEAIAAGLVGAAAVALLVGGWLLVSNRLRGRESKHYLRW